MSRLQRLPNGKLLALANGKLARECCCEPDEPTTGQCGSCPESQLPLTITATFYHPSGGCVCAGLHGKTVTLIHLGGCTWHGPRPRLTVCQGILYNGGLTFSISPTYFAADITFTGGGGETYYRRNKLPSESCRGTFVLPVVYQSNGCSFGHLTVTI